MKNVAKIPAVLLTCTMFIATCTAHAEEIKDTYDNVSLQSKYSKILDEYFLCREKSFTSSVNNSYKEITSVTSDRQITQDEMRTGLIDKLEAKWNATFVSADTTYTVTKEDTKNDKTVIDVYEWTNVGYTGASGLVDTFGYGVDHQIVIEYNGTEYCITSDIYDEGPLTEMSSSITEEKYIALMQEETVSLSNSQEIVNDDISAMQDARTVSGYNPYGAVEYANRWVSKTASGGSDYSNYYNYTEYATNHGADCTNYVSQCMYAGGVPMDNKWWYDKDYLWSYEWFSANAHFEHFSASNTYYENITSSTNIVPGNPMYYDYLNNDGWYDHAAICVGYNSNGVPIVNSHSNDYYHVQWNYITTGTYATVKLTNDDVLGTTAGAAKCTSEEIYYAKLNYGADQDFFKFTVPGVYGQSKSYTIKSTGNTNTFGKLYSNSGTLLTSNDNSGEGDNFQMTYTLTCGQTYYISVTGVNNYIVGFYGLSVIYVEPETA